MALPAGRRGIRANLVKSDGTLKDLSVIEDVLTEVKEDLLELSNCLSNIPVDFLGGVSALPSITKDGLFGFSTTANITISDVTLPAGTRCFGTCYSGIAHCIGIANGTLIYMLRYAGGAWSLLATK